MISVFGLRLAVALLWLVLLVPAPSFGQVNSEAYRDYFLVGRFGEVCTMCEVTVLCEAAVQPPTYEAIPGGGTFTIYHLQTRTFWSQIATIWEWFISNFSADSLAEQGHARPVHIYSVTAGQWSPVQMDEVRLVLDPGVVYFPGSKVDRISRQWTDNDGQVLGFCQRLPLWDALEVIGQRSVEEGGA